MVSPGGDFYIWIKALHVFAVIAWMAGILYLPRLFIYHVDAEKGSDKSETFKIMERRLYYGIMTPSMVAALGTGLWMSLAWLSDGWMHVKLLAAFTIFGFHMAYGRWRRHFEEDRNEHTVRFYKILNEIPAVLLIVIVIMVIVKPF